MSAILAPPSLRPIRWPDVVVVLAAAPILVLTGVPAAGYVAAGATWILLRMPGVAADRHATSLGHVVWHASLSLAHRTARVVLLAVAAVVASKVSAKDDGLAVLLVIVIAFTIQLTVAIVERPGPR
jgi:hypothetical protein